MLEDLKTELSFIKFVENKLSPSDERIKNLKRNYRKRLRVAQKASDSKVYYNGDTNYSLVYHLEWDGTKDELVRFLFENLTFEINSPYDCTGKHFTCWFQAVKIKDGLFKVREYNAIDV